jgi:hypothetical protein
MIPILARELWISNFARYLIADRPTVPKAVALETAENLWDKLMLIKPKEAVITFLLVEPDFYSSARERGDSAPQRPHGPESS